MGAARALATAALQVLPRVPPAWQGPISEVVGTIAYLAAPRSRAAVRANLAVISPERSLSARRVFVNQVRQYLEVFQIPRLDRARFDAVVRVEGWDNFLCAQRLGKGVIFGSAHLGPIALVGQVLITRGLTLTRPRAPDGRGAPPGFRLAREGLPRRAHRGATRPGVNRRSGCRRSRRRPSIRGAP